MPIKCWLVFDLSNGDQLSHRYVWWFDTRKAARDHIAWQKKQKHAAELSQPIKYIRELTWKSDLTLSKEANNGESFDK